MYKILIVEDHALTRFGLKTALETKEYISAVLEEASGEAAVKTAAKEKPDAVIMDLGLKAMNGIETAKALKKENNDIKIIILTSHSSAEEVLESIKAGASAFCTKDINPETLADILPSVIEGALWFDAKVSNTILDKIKNDGSFKTLEIDSSYNLTDREKEVINYICSGLNNSDIAKMLDVSINTVKVHVSSIIQKLGVEDRTQAAVKMFNLMKSK